MTPVLAYSLTEGPSKLRGPQCANSTQTPDPTYAPAPHRPCRGGCSQALCPWICKAFDTALRLYVPGYARYFAQLTAKVLMPGTSSYHKKLLLYDTEEAWLSVSSTLHARRVEQVQQFVPVLSKIPSHYHCSGLRASRAFALR